ncbi:ICOS ligand-like [Sinocyclocheilus grahami]|uniref:ICOS ligand-like n=1 Tax=Sinocyclocheilus grahami TaxID=75366 RepID=UPI0007AD2C25|nr:PREDICTED: ICOS ligand-like [Sinocyclocheilus grahami]
MNSCCFICVFAVLINKVCLQVTVEAVIGGSVVLPCSSTQHDHKLQDIDLSWRHNGSIIVVDIIPHRTSPMTQDPKYKNRTETFPEEYLRGNFSIKLNNLQHTDAGQYICYILHSSQYQTVELIINDSVSTEQGNQGETDHEGMGPSLPLLLVCIILLVLLISVIVFIVVFLRKKVLNQLRGSHS